MLFDPEHRGFRRSDNGVLKRLVPTGGRLEHGCCGGRAQGALPQDRRLCRSAWGSGLYRA